MTSTVRANVALALVFAVSTAANAATFTIPETSQRGLACGLTAQGDLLVVNDSPLPVTAGSRVRVQLGSDPLTVDLSDVLLPGHVLLVAGAGASLHGASCSATLTLASLVEV